ncbi:MAG: DUF2852 domain-containing protein [Hyphomicrobiales bacterium]
MVNCSFAGDRGFRPIELLAMILGFVFFWPLGLAILIFKLCGGHFPRFAGPAWRGESWSHGPWGGSGSAWSGWQGSRSGNSAFEEYRRATLERLEAERRKLAEEERAFADFLRELRRARDREEFDRFMQSRRQQGPGQA